MKITYDEKIPAEIRKAVSKDITRFKYILPPWLQELTIEYDNGVTHAETRINYRYRWAVIIIGKTFLEYTTNERTEAVLHEIIHIVLEPMQTVVFRLLAEKDYDKFAKDTYISGLEEAVSDLAHVLIKVFII